MERFPGCSAKVGKSGKVRMLAHRLVLSLRLMTQKNISPISFPQRSYYFFSFQKLVQKIYIGVSCSKKSGLKKSILPEVSCVISIFKLSLLRLPSLLQSRAFFRSVKSQIALCTIPFTYLLKPKWPFYACKSPHTYGLYTYLYILNKTMAAIFYYLLERPYLFFPPKNSR